MIFFHFMIILNKKYNNLALIYLISTILLINLTSCSVEKKPIEYGTDKCDNCSMTIVDNKFGSEIVNKKGKAFKFDAAECMIRYITGGEIKQEDMALTLVTAYNNPGNFIDAGNSYFLISDNLPSPMGGFLTSFKDKESAINFKEKYEGKIYNWDEIIKKFSE